MTFINKADVISGQVRANFNAPSVGRLNALQGYRYNINQELYVNSGTPLSTDQWTQGMRFTSDGALYIHIVDTQGVPANVDFDGGLPTTLEGKLITTTQAAVRYINGWPLDQRGYVCMNTSGVAPVFPGPFDFTAIASSESVTLDWDPSSNALFYDIFRDLVQIAHVTAPTLTFIDANATFGVPHSYTMAATNASGGTQSTSNPQVATIRTVPATPAAPTAVAGNTNATISWVPPANGGSAITMYVIQPFIGAAGQATQQTSNPSPYVFTGLTNGTTYTFKILATNGIGNSAQSPNSNAVTPAAAAAPGNFTFTAAVSGQTVPINWTAATGAVTYQIWRQGVLYQTVSAPTLTSTDSAPILGTNAAYTMFAINANGTTASTSNPQNALVPTVPFQPVAPVAVAGNTNAALSVVPQGDGGSAITNYAWVSSPVTTTQNSGVTPSITFTGLTNGVSYTFRVTATNAIGNSPQSLPSNAVTPNVVVVLPGAPTIGTATGGDAQAFVAFTPGSTGSNPTLDYTATSTPGSITAVGSGSPIVVTGLTNGTAYTFKVKARSVDGFGPESAASNSVTPAALPAPIFDAPLLTTLVPVFAAGSPTPTFTRGTTAYVTDFEGILRQLRINGARFRGARVTQNFATDTENMTAASWPRSNCNITAGILDPLGGTKAYTITSTANFASIAQSLGGINPNLVLFNSIWIRRRTGSSQIFLNDAVGSQQPITITTSWRRYAISSPPDIGTSIIGVFIQSNANEIDIAFPQQEVVSGASVQAPSGYVPNTPGAATPCGILGLQAFATTNGNSVASFVVTEAAGSPIAASTMLGYVSENLATNLCVQSQNIGGSGWGSTGIIVTNQTSTAPDGTLTASLCTGAATVAPHYMNRGPAGYVSATQQTTSIYVKPGTSQFFYITVENVANIFYTQVFNLSGAGSLGESMVGTTSGVVNTASIVALPNGWYRCSVVGQLTGSGTIYLLLGQAASASGNTFSNVGEVTNTPGSLTNTLWGIQVETSAQPSSYITTTTGTVTRNADGLSYPMAGNFGEATGTVYAEFWKPLAATAGQAILGAPSSSKNPLQIEQTAQIIQTQNPTANINGPVIVANNNSQKAAATWSGATTSISANGSAVGAGAFSAYAVGPICIGINQVPGTQALQGAVRNVKFYNVRLTNAELQALTT